MERRKLLCQRLRFIRKLIGLHAKDVASDLGIDPANLCKIEKGSYNFGVDTLIDLVDYYGWKIQIVLDSESLDPSCDLDGIQIIDFCSTSCHGAHS